MDVRGELSVVKGRLRKQMRKKMLVVDYEVDDENIDNDDDVVEDDDE